MQVNEIITRDYIYQILENSELSDKTHNLYEEEDSGPDLTFTALVGGGVVAVRSISSLRIIPGSSFINLLMPPGFNGTPTPEQLRAAHERIKNIPATTDTFKVDGKRVFRVTYPIGAVNGPGYADFPDRSTALRAVSDYNQSEFDDKKITPGKRADQVPDNKLPASARAKQRIAANRITASIKRFNMPSSRRMVDWTQNSRWFRVLNKLARYGAPVLIVTDFVDNLIWMIMQEAEKPEHDGDYVSAARAIMPELASYIKNAGRAMLTQLILWWASVVAVTRTIKLIIAVISNALRLFGIATGPGAPFIWILSFAAQIGFGWWASTASGQRALTDLWVWFLRYLVPGIIGDGLIAQFGETAANAVTPTVDREVETLIDRWGTRDSDEAEADAPTNANGELPDENPATTRTQDPTTTPSSTPSTPSTAPLHRRYQGFSFSN